MRMGMTAALAVLVCFALCSSVLAQGVPPPPGFGQPAPLPPANGVGQVTFNHGGTVLTLPLNKIEIKTSPPDMFMVSLTYVDAKQEDSLELHFMSMPKMGKNDPRMISGFIVKTKAHGLSRDAGNRTKCTLVIATLTTQDVSGTLSCTGMADLSAQQAAPDVSDVKFDGKLKAK